MNTGMRLCHNFFTSNFNSILIHTTNELKMTTNIVSNRLEDFVYFSDASDIIRRE